MPFSFSITSAQKRAASSSRQNQIILSERKVPSTGQVLSPVRDSVSPTKRCVGACMLYNANPCSAKSTDVDLLMWQRPNCHLALLYCNRSLHRRKPAGL